MIDLNTIEALLSDFTKTSPLNKVKELNDLTIFDSPIVGIASANDPLFLKLKDKEVIGPNHMSPKEWFSEAQAVISYFLPFSSEVRRSNYIDPKDPSTEWLYGRIEGEAFNNELRKFVSEKIMELGGNYIIPCHDSRYKVADLRSNWSERHIAYISGLGTFNLGKSLITKKGCAGRFGSVIVDLPLSPTLRSYKDIYEYCNNCGECISRCPVLAIDKNGKKHPPCDKFINDYLKKKFAPRYGCGKCQTNVPCEAGIPIKI